MMFLDRLNGSLRRITHNKVNIKRYMVLFQRLNMYLIGGALAIPFIVYNVFDDEYINKRNRTFNYHQIINDKYESYSELREYRGDPKPDYNDYYQSLLPRFYSDLAFHLISALVTLLPWLFIIFARPGAPVQVNRDKQLIYTWHRGKLYAARLDQLQPKFPASMGGLEFAGGWGPLVLHLYPAGKVYNDKNELSKGKKFKIGLYVPTIDWENKFVYEFIEKFLSNDVSLPEDYTSRKGWLEYAIRSPKKLPDDTVLDKAIDEWIAQEGKTPKQQITSSHNSS